MQWLVQAVQTNKQDTPTLEEEMALFEQGYCFVAGLDFPHVFGKFLQRGAQPGLVVSFFLILALMHVRNSRHLRDEGLDDLIDGFMDGHRSILDGEGFCRPAAHSSGQGPCTDN